MANDIELPQHVTDALISDDPGGSGVKVIRYRAELWSHFTDEDKERCLAYWRRMYCTDYTHLVVITEPDEADMLFADAEQTIVYQENMKRKPKEDFAETWIEQQALDLTMWEIERQVLVLLLAKLYKGSSYGIDGVVFGIPGIGNIYLSTSPSLIDRLPEYQLAVVPVGDQKEILKRIIAYARS